MTDEQIEKIIDALPVRPTDKTLLRFAREIERAVLVEQAPAQATFSMGQRVYKVKGSAWRGRIVGTYSTALTPEGYAVESENEPGSVQIYPALALAPQPPKE